MYRVPTTLALLACLAGCAPLAWQAAPSSGWGAPAARYDFDWRLSGDRQVAPLQVFDDGRRIWLQFAPGQALPAIFAQDGRGEWPVAYERRDPYIVVEGRWPALLLRGGRLRARADYVGAGQYAGAGHPADAGQRSVSHAGVDVADPVPATLPLTAHGNAKAVVPSAAIAPPPASAVLVAAPLAFHATQGDGNMRRALTRWAQASGWTFGAEHWAVDVDIPLAGAAEFGADFKQAVRDLMAATELADRPLQPCFYSNRVLRIVPLSHACDRTATPSGVAS